LPGIEAVEFSFPCALKMNLFGNNTPNAHWKFLTVELIEKLWLVMIRHWIMWQMWKKSASFLSPSISLYFPVQNELWMAPEDNACSSNERKLKQFVRSTRREVRLRINVLDPKIWWSVASCAELCTAKTMCCLLALLYSEIQMRCKDQLALETGRNYLIILNWPC
jgi:hypothetical protein